MAQDVKTYSVYDTNQSGDVNIADVTNVVDKVKASVSSASTQQYVTADELKTLLNSINQKLEKLERLNSIEQRLSAIEAKVGIVTPEDPSKESDNNGHAYVDLGLSVKWATMNVGATEVAGTNKNSHTGKLDCYGEYYAWGETSPKDSYTWSNLKYCSDSNGNSFTKYVATSSYGTVDNKTTLELSDDAARANWGGTWRMPTYSEQTELIENCYCEWTDSYNKTGVTGYIVYKVKNASDKGKIKYSGSSTTTVGSYSLSDNHIFLPAAGYRSGTNLNYAGSDGSYWSSSLHESYSSHAYGLDFGSGYVLWYVSYRCGGRSVRAVCP